jgi:cbb3-type cytochrome oxidase subunit 1
VQWWYGHNAAFLDDTIFRIDVLYSKAANRPVYSIDCLLFTLVVNIIHLGVDHTIYY